MKLMMLFSKASCAEKDEPRVIISTPSLALRWFISAIERMYAVKSSIAFFCAYNFQPIHLWEVVERVSTCDCCERCSRKLGKKRGSCKCACFEIYEVFTMALEKEAYDRLAKMEGRPTTNEIVKMAKLRKIAKN